MSEVDQTKLWKNQGLRRQAREAALSYLYQFDADVAPVTADVEKFLRHFRFDSACFDFAREIILGVLQNHKLIDVELSTASEHWKLYRMASIDRSILRLAAWELQYSLDTDVPVIIDEAVELARIFGSDGSSSFVNGILDNIAKKFRPQTLAS